MANFIWSICNKLRGPYKRNEYRKVILPLTVLRRFDSILEPTKDEVLAKAEGVKRRPESVQQGILVGITKRPFYNLSPFTFRRLLDDPNGLAQNLVAYMQGFSPNVRDIMDRFAFDQQVTRMAEKNLLYEVVRSFANIDLAPQRVDNVQMGYIFEELIRIGAEQANEEAGEHFTPREVIRLMVNLLLSPEEDLSKSHIVKTIYDPACGTGGMLSVAEQYIRELNADANPLLFGQDWNDEAWAICKSDMLIKGEEADRIRLGDSFADDQFDRDTDGKKVTFDYMLANPPFGVEWKQQQRFIEQERDSLGFDGRFGAGLPRINDGSLLFLQHMLSKMRPAAVGGSRVAIVFNGSPLFTGDAGSGESNIRQWIIENDWLEAIVGMPDQLFYNTGISTYVWVLTNKKGPERKGKVQLIDGRQFFVKMRKSLGNKRNKIGDPTDDPREPDQIADLTRIHGNFEDGETRVFTEEDPVTRGPRQRERVVSKVFDNEDFGFHRITVERPLRLSFVVSDERIARIEDESAFQRLATSKKRNEAARLQEIAEGEARQEKIRTLLAALAAEHGTAQFDDRAVFLEVLKKLERQQDVRLSAAERKAIINALGEPDPDGAPCLDSNGNPEADSDLRDTERVPLKGEIEEYFAREVAPHVPDAWIDHTKDRVGYEIPYNRHFFVYEPPRPLEEIEADLKALESEIVSLLSEVTA